MPPTISLPGHAEASLVILLLFPGLSVLTLALPPSLVPQWPLSSCLWEPNPRSLASDTLASAMPVPTLMTSGEVPFILP